MKKKAKTKPNVGLTKKQKREAWPANIVKRQTPEGEIEVRWVEPRTRLDGDGRGRRNEERSGMLCITLHERNFPDLWLIHWSDELVHILRQVPAWLRLYYPGDHRAELMAALKELGIGF
jgi:hypothetical protein